MSKQVNELAEKLQELTIQHEELLNRYNELQHEYSENTIIQSMHDMKERYERLVDTTVPNYKYELVEAENTKMRNHIIATRVNIEYILKLAGQLELKMLSSERHDLYKIQVHLTSISEMLDEF
jgi:phage-related minor tail protein